MGTEERRNLQKVALAQIIHGEKEYFRVITTRAINNVNSVMLNVVDEADLGDEYAELMDNWKKGLRQKLQILSKKAQIKLDAINEVEQERIARLGGLGQVA